MTSPSSVAHQSSRVRVLWKTCAIVTVLGAALLPERPIAGPQSAAAKPRLPVFTDVAAQRGLAFSHVNGASDAKHFPEIMGSGGLFFDFDDDGWLDVFLVDG